MGHFSVSKTSRFDKTPDEWLAVGAQIGEIVNGWAKRSDIVAFVGEGAGHGAPACFVPALAEVEVNVDLAFGEGFDPEFIGDLTRRREQFDYPVAMGAILHEAMHAKHSLYDLAAVAELKDKFLSGLITWFEETRIEARGVKAYPGNRSFLRSCALRLVLGDLKEDEDFTARGVQAFSQLMLLTLARVDAGVLDTEDIQIVHDAAFKFFGEETMRKLRTVWVRAQAHRLDDDWEPQLKLAEEWVEILKESGNDPADDPDGLPDWLKELLKSMVGEGSDSGDGEGEDGEGSGSGGGGMLSDMADDTEADAQGEGYGQAVQEIADENAKARAEAGAERETHKEMAGKVFGRGTGPGGGSTGSRLVEKRPATPKERVAAVALAKALDRARYRDRIVTKRSSIVPPGRLNTRRAIAAAEQKSRGAEVTAEAWKRKQRKHAEDPNLTVGVLVDISGSMGSAMEPMASSAWILSEAVRRIQGKVAMVYYGNDVFPVLKPGQHLPEVNVYSAPDGTEKFDKAFQALDGALNLTAGSGARLLVIVSDLYYTGHEGRRTTYWMQRCRDAGVAVIVVPFEYEDHAREVVRKIKGVEVVPCKATRDVVGAAKSIGASAIKQLEVASQ